MSAWRYIVSGGTAECVVGEDCGGGSSGMGAGKSSRERAMVSVSCPPGFF